MAAIGYSFAAFVDKFYDLVYPVGICIDFDDATDPNVTFPGTTWTRITDGRVVRAATGTTVGTAEGLIGSVAGADTISLVAENIPSHSHTMAHTHDMGHGHSGMANSDGAHTHVVNGTAQNAGEHKHQNDRDYPSTAGNTRAVSGGSVAQWQRGWTMMGGIHSHVVSGTAESGGAHTHTLAIDNFVGNTGASSAPRTGANGTGNSFDITNQSHYYARWKRTA